MPGSFFCAKIFLIKMAQSTFLAHMAQVFRSASCACSWTVIQSWLLGRVWYGGGGLRPRRVSAAHSNSLASDRHLYDRAYESGILRGDTRQQTQNELQSAQQIRTYRGKRGQFLASLRAVCRLKNCFLASMTYTNGKSFAYYTWRSNFKSYIAVTAQVSSCYFVSSAKGIHFEWFFKIIIGVKIFCCFYDYFEFMYEMSQLKVTKKNRTPIFTINQLDENPVFQFFRNM